MEWNQGIQGQYHLEKDLSQDIIPLEESSGKDSSWDCSGNTWNRRKRTREIITFAPMPLQ